MIKVTHFIKRLKNHEGKTTFLNAHKIRSIYQDDDGDVYIEFDVGGLYVKESIEDVLQQINKVLNGGNNE